MKKWLKYSALVIVLSGLVTILSGYETIRNKGSLLVCDALRFFGMPNKVEFCWTELPSVLRADLWIRRDKNDNLIEAYTLISDGRHLSIPMFEALNKSDDFKISIELSNESHAAIVWVDTNQKPFVLDLGVGKNFSYPEENLFVTVSASDPEGVHSIFFVDYTRTNLKYIQTTSLSLENLPNIRSLSQDNLIEVRGPGSMSRSERILISEYLANVEAKFGNKVKVELLSLIPAK